MTSPTPFRIPERLVLLHGYGAGPRDHWFPWLARQLAEVEIPALPDPTSPEAEAWTSLAAEAIGRTGPGTVVVTHSLGGATALRALARLRAQGRAADPLAAFIAVAPFARPLPPVGDVALDAFLERDLAGFLDGLDLASTRALLGEAIVIRSDDDPIVPAGHSDELAALIGARTVVVPGAGHFLAEEGMRELPQLLPLLRSPAG